MLSSEVKDRLFNWKFQQAQTVLDADVRGGYVGVTDMERDTIDALAILLGNNGWLVDEGPLTGVVRAAVWYCGVFDPEDEPHGPGFQQANA